MIACLTVPYFVAAVEQRDRPYLSQAPLIIGSNTADQSAVYAFSEEAAAQGVTLPMSVRRAQLLAPQALWLPAQQFRYRQAAAELFELLTDFTQLVTPDPLWLPDEITQRPRTALEQQIPARYFIDLKSLSGEQALSLMQEIGRTIQNRIHLSPVVGVAPFPLAAAIAAYQARPLHVVAVDAHKVQQFIYCQPLRFLPLAEEIRTRLQLLKIETVGDLMMLPLQSLVSQLGGEMITLYQLVHGQTVVMDANQGQTLWSASDNPSIQQLAQRHPQAVYQAVHLGSSLLPEHRFEFRRVAV